jgi:hypothetical protein
VFGEILDESRGGPFRSTHDKHLGAQGRRYLIGRGGAAEFLRNAIDRESALLARVALAQLTLGLVVLGCLALRPFV